MLCGLLAAVAVVWVIVCKTQYIYRRQDTMKWGRHAELVDYMSDH